MSRTRRWLVYTLLAVLISGLFLAVWAFLIEPNRLVIHRETISLYTWPHELGDIRIALISDIHAGSSFIDVEKLKEVVARTNAEKPDLIVLLGDYMVTGKLLKNAIEPEIIAAALKDLQAPGGVYAILGNHDWWYDGSRVRRALEDVGIRVLDNEVAPVAFKGNTFWLCGLADAWTRPQDISGTLRKVPSSQPVVVLTHTPLVW